MIWTGLALALCFSLAGVVTLALLAPWLVHSVLEVRAPLRPERYVSSASLRACCRL